MLGMESQPPLCLEVDLREELRLQVVGVACELVTLQALVEEDARDGVDSAQALASQARELAAKARAVLSPSTNFGALSEAVLRAAVAVLSDNVVSMRQIRETVAQLTFQRRPPHHHT